jgi:hypothetical protein
MLLQEAQWFNEQLPAPEPSQVFPMCNVGSSTAAFRTQDQPWIDELLFALLSRGGRIVTHLDMKPDPGVDIVGEYVFTPQEHLAPLKKAGFCIKELIPLSPHCIGAKGPVRKRLIQALRRRFPWCQAHMMATICCKEPSKSTNACTRT